MTITYELHLWQNGISDKFEDEYLPLKDGMTGLVRYKKILDGEKILANLDINLPLTELTTISASELKSKVDKLITADESKDTDLIEKARVTPPTVNSVIKLKVKNVNPKARTVDDPPKRKKSF